MGSNKNNVSNTFKASNIPMTLVTEKPETKEEKASANPLSRSSTTIAFMTGPNKGQYFEMPTTGVVVLG